MRHCHWTRLPTNRKTVFIFLLNFLGNKPIGKIYDRSPSHLEHSAPISLINEIRKWIKECDSFAQRWCFLRKNQDVIAQRSCCFYTKFRRLCTQRSVFYTQRSVGFLHIRRNFTQRYAILTQRSGCFVSKGQAVFTSRSGYFICKGQVAFYAKVRGHFTQRSGAFYSMAKQLFAQGSCCFFMRRSDFF